MTMTELCKIIASGCVWLVLLNASQSFAADIYFAPTSAGSNNGTNCANAYAYNDGTHGWSLSAQQAAGNILHPCSGTYTGTSGATILSTVNNGSNGNPITILCDQGAVNLTAPYWGGAGSGAFNISNNFWTFNGNGNCTIQNTANGTSLANQQPSTALYLSGTNSVTVENFTIANICQHTSSSDNVACNNGGNNDHAVKIINGATGLVIQGNTIHDSQNCIEFNGNSGDTVTIQQNTISRCNWGTGGFGLSSSFIVTGNDISCVTGGQCNWQTTADTFHHNGVILFPQTGNISGAVISNNYIHDIGGTTGSSGTETGHIFLDPGGTGNIPNVQIYNNILVTTSGGVGPTNAYIKAERGSAGPRSITTRSLMLQEPPHRA